MDAVHMSILGEYGERTMPIYEYYCAKCHALYNFFARSSTSGRNPSCPSCKAKNLKKQVSPFAMISSDRQDEADEELPIDETTMMRAMESLASKAESVNEEDPRQAADLMRQFSSMTGMQFSENMEQAMSRLESGEDPESIESDMGKLLDAEDPFVKASKANGLSAALRQQLPPRRDDTLYDL